MPNIYTVKFSKKIEKNLIFLPNHILKKLRGWVASVGESGLIKVSKLPSYHDEPLKGNRNGQRSIRLNKAYRAIYQILNDRTLEFVEIIEVNKHDY